MSGSIAAFSCSDRQAAERISADAADVPSDLDWGKAPCRFCGTGCGVEVGVKDGRVVAVRGDEASPVNSGLLCVKGYHLPGFLYGEDRLTHPLRATGRPCRAISWDEALDLIARGVPEARSTTTAPSRWRSTAPVSGPSTTATPRTQVDQGRACGRTTSTPTRASAWRAP